MKVMLPAVELCLAPSSVTVHEVIDGRPVSLKVTAYLVTLNEIATCTGVPFTVTEAEAGEAVYPGMPPTAKQYVPFGAENMIVVVVELSDAPCRVTDPGVPDGSPDSVNVTRGGVIVENTLTVSEPKFATYTYSLRLSYPTPWGAPPTGTVPTTVVPPITLTLFEPMFDT